ncbi:MAG: GreA/GreB family elongation factor [Actinomycetota bacterium]
MVSNPQDIVVSPETLTKMQAELEELTTVGRDEMSVRLLRAREMGDLKENAEYHSAKDAQGLMEARIRQLQNVIKNAVVRKAPASAEIIGPGVVVTLKDGDETSEYLVADSVEEKTAGLRTITPTSPMGKAVVGKKAGDTAEIEAPGGKFSVEIVGLRPA